MSAEKRLVILRDQSTRRRAHEAIDAAPDGMVVRISPPAKKREQEEKYHAMIADIARQVEYAGRKWETEDMKRLLVDEFAEEMRSAGTPLHHDGRVVPSFDGRRIVQLGIQTSRFYVKEAAQFIEYLYAYGAQYDVKWSA